MHISDGVLPFTVNAGGYAVSCSLVYYLFRGIELQEMTKLAVMTAVFFVASLIHVPLGVTSVHLVLNGLVGILLGPTAFLAVFIGVVLQAILFQFGGLGSLGVNALILGVPSLISYAIFRAGRSFKRPNADFIFGVLAGAAGTFCSGIIMTIFLFLAGESFLATAKIALYAHLPVMLIEGLVAGFAVRYIENVKPELLDSDLQNSIR